MVNERTGPGSDAVAGPAPMPREIIDYYSQAPETERLTVNADGELEFARTMEIITRHLPPAPAVVLDVGGGTGVYAAPLARAGYAVNLLDLIPVHAWQARAVSRQQAAHPLSGILLGDARALPWRDECADVVLLLGPLYHLTEREDRLRTLAEARRVLRPGGVVCAIGVSRFASLMAGLYYNQLEDPEYVPLVEQDLRDGQHRNPTPRNYWTTAFFHHPDELRGEVEAAGFGVAEVAAVEGPQFAVRDLSHWWNDAHRRALLLWAIRSVEHEPSLLGLSSHVMVVGRKG
ncbi:MAG: methyltransferase domain-containing protein [Dehalococcoidia bacterium]